MVGITVVIPVWYGQEFLGHALHSVRQQEKLPYPIQLIVVEDGTPRALSCEFLADQYHAEYHYLPENGGVAAARRFGASLSVFDAGYLAFLDQDDRWYPEFLATMVQTLEEHTRHGFAVCNADVAFPSGSQYRLYQTKTPSLRLGDLKMFNHIVTPSQVLMRLSAFRQTGWTGELDTPGADDWLLWLTLTSRGFPGLYVPVPLMAYLEHDAGAHQDISKMRQSEASVVRGHFRSLGFRAWDERRYFAGVNIESALHLARRRQWKKSLEQLSATAARDPRAFLSAGWYRVERKIHHWV